MSTSMEGATRLTTTATTLTVNNNTEVPHHPSAIPESELPPDSNQLYYPGPGFDSNQSLLSIFPSLEATLAEDEVEALFENGRFFKLALAVSQELGVSLVS